MLLGIYENLKLIVKLFGGCGHSGHGILKVAVQYFKYYFNKFWLGVVKIGRGTVDSDFLHAASDI